MQKQNLGWKINQKSRNPKILTHIQNLQNLHGETIKEMSIEEDQTEDSV